MLLAGGQGTRLGFDKPKGTFNIGLTRELYIFECLIGNLLEVTKAAGTFVPLFIMTSIDNYDDTRNFFEEHNYFGYDSSFVWFFRQEQLPATDPEGRLLLAGPGKIATAPNGNGGWYVSMEKTGTLNVIRERGIEWLNVFAMDNVLQRIADPCFVGAVIGSGMTSGAKVVAKAAPDEKVGVICLEDGRPSIVEYYELTEELMAACDVNKDGSVNAVDASLVLSYYASQATDDEDKALEEFLMELLDDFDIDPEAWSNEPVDPLEWLDLWKNGDYSEWFDKDNPWLDPEFDLDESSLPDGIDIEALRELRDAAGKFNPWGPLDPLLDPDYDGDIDEIADRFRTSSPWGVLPDGYASWADRAEANLNVSDDIS